MESREGGSLHYSADYTRHAVGRELHRLWETSGPSGIFEILVLNPFRALLRDIRRLSVRGKLDEVGSRSVRVLSMREAVLCRTSAAPLGLRLANVVSKMNGERVVEIPLAKSFAAAHKGQRIAEIGNVMSYYIRLPEGWDVFDKYERTQHVMNVDVLELHSPATYDAVIAISTLEHVGWDEQSRDPALFLAAVKNLCNLLSPKGEGLLTVPLHYNPVVDSWALGPPPEGFSFNFIAPVGRGEVWVVTDRAVASRESRAILAAYFKPQPSVGGTSARASL
jgi:hypothetical protein